MPPALPCVSLLRAGPSLLSPGGHGARDRHGRPTTSPVQCIRSSKVLNRPVRWEARPLLKPANWSKLK